MAKHRTHRTHSIAFKRQVVQEYLAGETLRKPPAWAAFSD